MAIMKEDEICPDTSIQGNECQTRDGTFLAASTMKKGMGIKGLSVKSGRGLTESDLK